LQEDEELTLNMLNGKFCCEIQMEISDWQFELLITQEDVEDRDLN
jgi:hypothetical protein